MRGLDRGGRRVAARMLIDGREWLTSERAASHFGLSSPRAFREWADRAGLPSMRKLGSTRRLWDREEIEARLRAASHTPAAAPCGLETDQALANGQR